MRGERAARRAFGSYEALVVFRSTFACSLQGMVVGKSQGGDLWCMQRVLDMSQYIINENTVWKNCLIKTFKNKIP
jgi:hypothetical protein